MGFFCSLFKLDKFVSLVVWLLQVSVLRTPSEEGDWTPENSESPLWGCSGWSAGENVLWCCNTCTFGRGETFFLAPTSMSWLGPGSLVVAVITLSWLACPSFARACRLAKRISRVDGALLASQSGEARGVSCSPSLLKFLIMSTFMMLSLLVSPSCPLVFPKCHSSLSQCHQSFLMSAVFPSCSSSLSQCHWSKPNWKCRSHKRQ